MEDERVVEYLIFLNGNLFIMISPVYLLFSWTFMIPNVGFLLIFQTGIYDTKCRIAVDFSSRYL